MAVEGGTARRREYYLTERLYNIYYLLRRDGVSNRVVEALIDFMTCFYSPAEIWDFVKQIPEQVHESVGMPTPATEYFAMAMNLEGLRFAELGQVNEALEVYDDMLRGSGPDGGPRYETWVADVLIRKACLLFRVEGRETETIVACDVLLSQFSTREDNSFRETVAAGGLLKGIALFRNGHIAEAVRAVDEVVMRYETTASPGVAGFVSLALIAKSVLFGLGINEDEASILLKCLEQEDELHWGVIQALTRFSASVGAKRTLELIQDSEAAPLLLPLVTALQHELGQVTHVAKEVDEVAGDVRRQLAQIAFSAQAGTPTVRATLTVTSPSGEPAEC